MGKLSVFKGFAKKMKKEDEKNSIFQVKALKKRYI